MVMIDGPGDIDLVKTDSDGRASLTGRRARPFAILAFAGLLVLALVGYLFLRRGQPGPAQPAPTQPTEAVKIRQDPADLIPLPPLDETDALVRRLVAELSSHPVAAAWLTTDRLIVNFVVVTGRIADGQTPVAELKPIGPVPPFRTRTSRGALFVDPSSYRRYDRYAQAVSALDARGTVRLYETIKPRVNEADRNFGGSGRFDAVLERAIVELLKVPVVSGDVALRSQGLGYAYADPRLEDLSPAQKQLLRMGPDNVRAVQSKLREIASYLAIPESRLPQPPSPQ